MKRHRSKPNSVILPDGRIFVAGGVLDGDPDGGPAEIFDPDEPDPMNAWFTGASMKYSRGYHSSAILLPDGSVLMGGDKLDAIMTGETTPHEIYLPGYYFKPRPIINSVTPNPVSYNSNFTIKTSDTSSIAKVVFLRPGAVTHGVNMSQRSVNACLM